jgi:hypothetical protein
MNDRAKARERGDSDQGGARATHEQCRTCPFVASILGCIVTLHLLCIDVCFKHLLAFHRVSEGGVKAFCNISLQIRCILLHVICVHLQFANQLKS